MRLKIVAAACTAAVVAGSAEARQPADFKASLHARLQAAPARPQQAEPSAVEPARPPARPAATQRSAPPATVKPAPGAPAPAAQAPQAPTPAPAETAPSSPPADLEPINVRYRIAVHDTGGSQPGTKTVIMTATVGQVSSVRATGTVGGRGSNPLNVDVWPRVIRDGKVQTRISIEYVPQSPPDTVGPAPLSIRQTVFVWLDNRADMVVSTATDPNSERRLEVAATAEILR